MLPKPTNQMKIHGHIYTAEGWQPYNRNLTDTEYMSLVAAAQRGEDLHVALNRICGNPESGLWSGKVRIDEIDNARHFAAWAPEHNAQ